VRVREAGGKSVVTLLCATAMTLALALAAPVLASAESFEVNSTADETDAVPGNELCLTAGGKCTLRAAIEEANSSEEGDNVSFEREKVFTGQIAGTISLGTGLPPIVHPIAIFGECVIENLLRPCVGVDGPGPSAAALTVEGTEAEIYGLALTGAKTGIEVNASPRLRVFSNWLGVKLDGSAGGNGTGIMLGKGSEDIRIGNEGESNVFANSVEDGLDIHGVSGVRVMSGYFGVGPDGVTPAPNGGKDIEVASFEGSEASGTRIGTQLSREAAATPACDGGCNVIVGAGSSGIDLEGDGEKEEAAQEPKKEGPAASTTIVGNYIGLDATGAAAPNTADGVRVGKAARTVIGGPRTTEANRFAGGKAAVAAGPAPNLVVRGNSVGVDGGGAGSLVPPSGGFLVDSEGLPSAAEAAIAGNELRMRGGVAIDLNGLGGLISGNRIAGAGIGISASGETEEHGNLIEGNLIEGSATSGILLESGFNEVFANEILGSGGPGVRIAGAIVSPQFGVSRNLVGGDAGADENLIAASGGAAIEISNPEGAANGVARNRGFANGGPFIDLDLVPFPGDKNKGTNGGIQPPKFFVAAATEARGGNAEPDATVRVFRKAGGEAGEIASFLGEAIVDEEGEWRVRYDGAIPDGTIVAATQTSAVGGTSELAPFTTPMAPSAKQGCLASGGCDAPPAGVSPGPAPQTKIFKGPKRKKSVGATAVFKFEASIAGSTFQCRLDGRSFRKCHSPQVYTGLRPGRHRFEVRAIGSAGPVDPSPAKLKFTVIG
jgi:CSLREA domain-containing protein